jgi:hypothetical protein
MGAWVEQAEAFVHPGVLNNRFELEFMKAQVAAGLNPWKAGFDKLRSDPTASLGYTPKPRAAVDCGSYNNPDYGCTDERNDSRAANVHVLQWIVTGDERYAQKAAEILDAWSSTLKSHGLSNAALQCAWTGGPFLQAAEVLRYTYPKWDKAHVDAFSKMMNEAFLPKMYDGNGTTSKNGNWEASMVEGMLALAVFDENQALWDHALEMWKKRLPEYIYASADGPLPVIPNPAWSKSQVVSFWNGQSTFMDGLCQETCRDMGHTQQGLGSLVHGAEIAWNQGVDIYSRNDNRLMLGMEFQAKYMLGEKPPSNLCGGKLSNLAFIPMWEIGYNHYHDWMKMEMPNAGKVLEKSRPEGQLIHLFYGTLTHYAAGSQGQAWPPAGHVGVIMARNGRVSSVLTGGAASGDGPRFDLTGRLLPRRAQGAGTEVTWMLTH